jgi:hypothetical protein
MRQMKMVNLYFGRDEVHEALRQWCEKNHPSVVKHFNRICSMDWVSDRPRDSELCLSFDGEIEDVIETSDDTRIFVKK